jgi:transcriptional regulator with XRE-family HTH domain
MATKRHRLAQRRKTVGFTQETLAEKLGVDSTTVRRWESGEASPQPWTRPKLARYLQVSLDQLEKLLHEPGTNDLLGDSPGVGSDVGSADLAVGTVGPQQGEPLRQGLHDMVTEGSTTSAEASSREVALAKAYAEARARARSCELTQARLRLGTATDWCYRPARRCSGV